MFHTWRIVVSVLVSLALVVLTLSKMRTAARQRDDDRWSTLRFDLLMQ